MKNIRDIKCTRLSKRQMGIISGGAKFKCTVTNPYTNQTVSFTMEFDSGQDILAWYNTLPIGAIGECINLDTAEYSTNTDPSIDNPGF